MKFVPEEIIDKVIGELEVDGITESLIEDLKQSQPVVFSYLFSDSFDLSTQDEKEYLLYMVMVAWLSMMKVKGSLVAAEEEHLGEAEETNWMLINNSRATTFRDRLTVLFEDSKQEDLLAFAEDMLTDLETTEETEIVTKEGRELLFVAYKSIVDAIGKVNY